jgi:putative tricarboxylic transport membrane protein
MSMQDVDRPVGEGGAASAAPLTIHRTDMWISILLLIFCALVFWGTTAFDEVPPMLDQGIGPEFFPRLLLWPLVGLLLVMPFEVAHLNSNPSALEKSRSKPIVRMTYYTFVLLLGTIAIMPWLGVFVALVVICIALPVMWGETSWKLIAPFAILFPSAVTILFVEVLQVSLELGILRPLFR